MSSLLVNGMDDTPSPSSVHKHSDKLDASVTGAQGSQMQLFSKAGTCALSVHIAIYWLNLPIQVQNLSKEDASSSWYRAINPSGKVPALRLASGQVMTEAVSILRYLAELSPASRLDGETAEERQEVAEALSFMTSEVHANWGPFFRPNDFIADASPLKNLVAKTIDRLSENYAQLNRQLGARSYIALNRRTVADAYLYVLTRWLQFLPPEPFQLPDLARHKALMEADSAVIAAVHHNEKPTSNTI